MNSAVTNKRKENIDLTLEKPTKRVRSNTLTAPSSQIVSLPPYSTTHYNLTRPSASTPTQTAQIEETDATIFDPTQFHLHDKYALSLLDRQDLDALCIAHGLSTSGTKQDVLARLEALPSLFRQRNCPPAYASSSHQSPPPQNPHCIRSNNDILGKQPRTAAMYMPTLARSPPPPPKVTAKAPRAKSGPKKKHPVHWYPNGDIFVQVGGFQFKLYHAVLARQSGWFRNTLTHGHSVGNLPLYHLDGMGFDARDFEIFLDAFDNAITYAHTQPSFQTITSILRVSTALSAKKYKSYASECLHTMWSPRVAKLTTVPIPHATESIILARQYGLSPILKRAMYELVRLEGFGQPKPAPSGSAAPLLTAHELSALVYAREQLTNTWNKATDSAELPLCAQASNTTSDGVACTATSPARTSEVYRKVIGELGIVKKYRYDPVCGLWELRLLPWAQVFCRACVERLREMWLRELLRVWRKLDGWFGLE
ncbi:hypothetical protein FPV67DRAFT_1159129 [Lyophyllum atratum]|nr:hypothetical protein FPV67DRAFT_1159129 [Lyophyllum atratum]